MEVLDICNRNALIESAANNDVDILEALVLRKARLNQQDSLGRSALIEASAEGHSVIVFQLLATLGIPPPAVAAAAADADLCADTNIDSDLYSEILNAPPYDEADRLNLDLQDWDGRTALICACEEGHTEIALALIRAGAALDATSKMSENACDKSFGRTALIEACERGLKDVVEALIAAGADLNMRDTRGRTALISACVWGHDEIAKGMMFSKMFLSLLVISDQYLFCFFICEINDRVDSWWGRHEHSRRNHRHVGSNGNNSK